MLYEKLEGISVPLSKLVMGSNAGMVTDDPKEAAECLDMAWEIGFRAFDTAHSYGTSEENIGAWMAKRGNRGELVLMDKGCNPGQAGSTDVFSGEMIREQLKMSLDRLQTDYVDIYALHRDDESRPVEEIVETLHALKEEGKIRRFGGSNWKQYRIEMANRYAKEHGLSEFSVLGPAYSLADYVRDPWGGSVSLSGEENRSYREWLVENQMPVLNYSSLARGFLSGRFRSADEAHIDQYLREGTIKEYYDAANMIRLRRAEELAEKKGATVSQVCLAWLLAQEINLFPLIGASTESHMREAAGAFDISLSEEECRWLHDVN
ncbi:MAG: aldo/keto reductase [Ruminococcus sp.]|nr:aldo/keto reductase [Ruminococcus sp.]